MKHNILDSGFSLSLRPLTHPVLWEMMNAAENNTWTVEEIPFETDLVDLKTKFSVAETHLIHRLVAFFATGDIIVANNAVINLYKHINSPEARCYLTRQAWEESLHVKFYLTLLDNYIPDMEGRMQAFAAIENIPSIAKKGAFCLKYLDSIFKLQTLETKEDRRKFLLNLTCFSSCIEGLFFFAAFSYVFFLRSKGYLHGLASGTNYVFRDESMHMNFAFEVIDIIRNEEPDLWDAKLEQDIVGMMREAVDCEYSFAEDLLSGGIVGMNYHQMKQYLEYIADQRLLRLGIPKQYGSRNPFDFMELQDVQELTNFFERRPSSYQVGIKGSVAFDHEF